MENHGGEPQKLAGKEFYILFWELTGKQGDRREFYPAHIAYGASLEADGRLMGAGPFLDESGAPDGRGMFILRVGSRAEAHEIAKADPFYVAGFRTYRLEAWRRNEGSFTLTVNVGANRVTMN
jgi:uncharacterized protein YciI